MATRRQMKAHVIRYPCRLCSSSFQTEKELKVHFKTHLAINNPLGKTGNKKVHGHHLPMNNGPMTKKPCNRVINLKNEQVALAKGNGQGQGESSGESFMVKGTSSSGDQDKKLGKEYEA